MTDTEMGRWREALRGQNDDPVELWVGGANDGARLVVWSPPRLFTWLLLTIYLGLMAWVV